MELGTPDPVVNTREQLPSVGELTGRMNSTRLDSDSTQNPRNPPDPQTPLSAGRQDGRRTRFNTKPEVRGKKKMVRPKSRTSSAPADSPASRLFQNTAETVHHIFPLAGERVWVGRAASGGGKGSRGGPTSSREVMEIATRERLEPAGVPSPPPWCPNNSILSQTFQYQEI